MTDITGYIATGVVSLIVGILTRYLEPKSRIVYWSPHNFLFELKDPPVLLQTNSLTIQNLGGKSAENIEIIHKVKPDFFQLSPPISFVEETNTKGEHIIRINSLGSKEFITLQLLSYKTAPILLNVRSKEGAAELIQIQLQRVFSAWIRVLFIFLEFVGAGFLVYWLIKAVIFISKSIGIG
jgi:hypothetical protein